jgi:DNA-directed RNA polymerase subunit RPC12/RpoP
LEEVKEKLQTCLACGSTYTREEAVVIDDEGERTACPGCFYDSVHHVYICQSCGAEYSPKSYVIIDEEKHPICPKCSATNFLR